MKYKWDDSSGMLGWKSESSKYRDSYINYQTHGLIPEPWSLRNTEYSKEVVISPLLCDPLEITFKLQGGVSPVSSPANEDYMGIVLVKEKSGVVVRQMENKVIANFVATNILNEVKLWEGKPLHLLSPLKGFVCDYSLHVCT